MFNLVAKLSTSCWLVVSTNSTKETESGPSLWVTGISLSMIFGVLKFSKAWMTVLIIVTSSATPTCGIANGLSLGIICSFDSYVWILTAITNISIGFVGKGETQEIVIGFAPPLINLGLSLVLPIGSSYKFTIVIFLFIRTLIILPLMRSYL